MSTANVTHNYKTIQQEDDEGIELENISIDPQQRDQTEIAFANASNVDIEIEQSFSDAEEDQDDSIKDKGMRLTCYEACKLTKHYKSWILTILIWSWIIIQITCIIINSQTNISCISISVMCPSDNWQFNNRIESIISLIVIGVALLFYLLEICCSTSCRYVFSTVNNNGCEQYIEDIKQTDMEIWWNIECYHIVTTSRGAGRGRRSSSRKVVTHRARHKFDYTNCRDATKFDMKQITDNINKYGIGKIKFDVTPQFANKQTEHEYIRQRTEFIEKNRRDRHQSVWTIEYPRDYGLQSFAVENKDWVKSNASKYLNAGYYILAALTLCLPCYKWWMTTIIGDNKYKVYTYTFIKELNIFIEKDPLINGIFRSIFKDDIILPNDVCGLIKKHCGDVHKAPQSTTLNNNIYGNCIIL